MFLPCINTFDHCVLSTVKSTTKRPIAVMLALCSSATCTIILAPTTQIFFNQNKMFLKKNSKAILFLRSELLEQTVSCNMNIEYASKRYVYCIKLIFCRDNIGTCRARETTHHPHRPPPDRSINPILTGGRDYAHNITYSPPCPRPPGFSYLPTTLLCKSSYI